MNTTPPMTIDADSVYIEVFYLTTDKHHKRYKEANDIRNHAQCGDINNNTWKLYDRVCEGIFCLKQLPGECSVGLILSHIYSKFQKNTGGTIELRAGTCTYPRRAAIGDIIAIDGMAYFIDLASTFTFVGSVEDLSSPSEIRGGYPDA